MSNDRLSEVTQALRETEAASEFEARSTRARVMSGLHQTRVHRRTRLVFLLPIAASFIALSAWGAANGKAQLVYETIEHWVSPTPPIHANVNVNVNVHARDLPASPAAAPDLTPAPVLGPAPAPDLTAAPMPARAHALAPSPPVSVAQHAEPSDPTLALYRAAHTAHFVDHDPTRALAGWDAYLAAAPSGPFVPEARYNRALSLVRLGRNAEARVALEPFANGTYGGYRKDEASALLERLSE
jgi:hypothetical protein